MAGCRQYTCDKCKNFIETTFRESFPPEGLLEGKLNSRVWIIGLNPKLEEGEYENRTQRDLEEYFNKPGVHGYFKDFKTVSSLLYNSLGKEKGVAHTDLIKCKSKKYDFKENKISIIQNCQGYLQKQIERYKPKVIICNGADTSQAILTILPPEGDQERLTSYVSNVMGYEIRVVLSGFIGRIDNYAKRRLGEEIEKFIQPLF